MTTSTDGPGALPGPFVRVPPPHGDILVPLGPRPAAAAAVAMWGASRPRARALRLVLWVAARTGGGHLIPGRRQAWHPHAGTRRAVALLDALDAVAGPVEAVAVGERRQGSRPGVHLIGLRHGAPAVFLRAQPDRGAYAREAAALAAVGAARPLHFEAPTPLGHGRVDDWEWIALTALPARPHRPDRRAPIAAVAAEVTRGLATAPLPGADDPPHWVPMHGDLTPWNLRRLGRRRVLFDWEDAAWGPPGADVAYYLATRAALFGGSAPSAPAEVVAFWEERVARRAADDADAGLNTRVLEVLAAMRD